MTDTTSWPTLISSLLAREDLSVADATWAMQRVMTGEASDAQLAGFLVALSAKGETVDEIVGFPAFSPAVDVSATAADELTSAYAPPDMRRPRAMRETLASGERRPVLRFPDFREVLNMCCALRCYFRT